MGSRRLAATEVERIVEMREKGLSCAVIARIIGCSPGAVAWQCLKYGAEPPLLRGTPVISHKGPPVSTRNGHLVRLFTPEEDNRLRDLSLQGLKPVEIGRALGRRHNSITSRLRILARHEERLFA